MQEITSIENARKNHEEAQSELSQLQAENDALPNATAKALESLDVEETERLRRRRAELPSYMDVARVRVAQTRQALIKVEQRALEQSAVELKERAVAAGHESDREIARGNKIIEDARFALQSAHNAWQNEEAKLQMIRAHLVGSERELQQLLSGQAAKAA
jgi:uncharacterized membrane protein